MADAQREARFGSLIRHRREAAKLLVIELRIFRKTGEHTLDPNRLSAETGVSIYDLFMHLNPSLPRVLV